jgi:hypothetical protein
MVPRLTSLIASASANELPPRWKIRASLIQGFGGSWDQGPVADFPTTLELGVRLAGPLSLAAGATGMLTGDSSQSCGELRRPSAIWGHAGLRVDFNNRKGDSWLDPFVEAHGGVGYQAAASCVSGGAFPTAGVRGGLDVWLGRAAVTVAVGFDWMPIAPPASAYLGATFLLH